jgi:hypothetical protein
MSKQGDETFSFRWGIPLLDDGRTPIPNFMLDHWHETPVTRIEFLAIIHLARYQYERAGSESRPAVGTVAEQMGYGSDRGLQFVLASLEKKGLLVRCYQEGKPTIYDFSGFSRAVLEAALPEVEQNKRSRGEETFTPHAPGGEEIFTPGVKKPSPKEEKIRREWDRTLADLSLQMTRSTFDRWLAGSELLTLEDGTATVRVRDAYAVDWCSARLRLPIERTLSGILGRAVACNFVSEEGGND